MDGMDEWNVKIVLSISPMKSASLLCLDIKLWLRNGL